MVNDLLDIARFDSNSSIQLVQKEKLDLVKEIKDNLQNIQLPQRIIQDKDIKIKFQVLPSSPSSPSSDNNKSDNDDNVKKYFVNADKKRLCQILNNLISNAVKFSNPGDTVTVSITKDTDIKRSKEHPNQVLVSVSDGGRGISSKVMPNLFERFVRF